MIIVTSQISNNNLKVTGGKKSVFITAKQPTTSISVSQYPNVTIIGGDVLDLDQRVGDTDFNFRDEANIYLTF